MASPSRRKKGRQPGGEGGPMLKAKAERRIQTIRCSSTDHKRGLRGALVCAPKPFFVISTLWGCSFLGQSHHCIGRGASIPDQEISSEAEQP
ncbi:hypothetical protein MGG_16363 [Pyricularia oryzae 70-15]|uniref:Uncharacterized protein n=1 Tax=Pyricularia oryzae (strain 70-15 / ATCC MYA-4617 / FGSC 8958) TaxID=242507 RepID=G4MLS5_PYRO7|nr:uncharacterized protein MGG_16363 [Pyricularia oryzae 70-15]EHA57703.1 hypothetical protein MGG_16363 [Pyricularia oryzae 70-15]